ncbi:hypothetical protein [Acinetobacter haemolyticus]|uniref:hypothetical protein n=1 Tax=Acinetobacter haemolyticus TaxID=29430 RepID=UPI0020904C68|nr:hypothetical protein [Acinetobacter haemolyticus]
MNNNPFERVSKNKHQYEDVIKTKPDVIFMTMKFHEELLKNTIHFLQHSPMHETLFGMKYYIVRENDLDGLDFQCFKSSHLNGLVERYNRDNRWQTYELEIYVPTRSTYDVSFISNGSAAPTSIDMDPLKRVKIVVPNAVLRAWIKKNAPSGAKYCREKNGEILYYTTDMIGSRHILYIYENDRWEETTLKDWSVLSEL